MARPANVQHWVLSGDLPAGEKWATGYWTANGAPDNYNQASADNWVNANGVSGFLIALRALMSTVSHVQQITLYAYGPSNQGAQGVYSASLGNLAGTGAGNLPNQTACCLSLRTALATARGRGRMYLPANGAVLGSSQFTTGVIQSVVSAAATMLGATDAVVLSETAGITSVITRVQSDIIPDTQRRRRDAEIAPILSANVV